MAAEDAAAAAGNAGPVAADAGQKACNSSTGDELGRQPSVTSPIGSEYCEFRLASTDCGEAFSAHGELSRDAAPAAGDVSVASPSEALDFPDARIASEDPDGDGPAGVSGLEESIRFLSRADGNKHVGHLVRQVELLGREYLMVRSEPQPERLREGHQSAIHLFGMGFRNPKNNDIVLLHSDLESGTSSSSSSGSTSGRSCSRSPGRGKPAARKAIHSEEEAACEEEAGVFVPDPRHFRRSELLGSGGFADVYRYARRKPPRPGQRESYAVKEVDIQKLSQRCGADQECLVRWIARLEYEVRNQLKLSGHPGVVTVHDAFVHRGLFYIVMDFVRGTDLGRRLQSRGRLPEEDARSIFAQAAEALRHSHALGVIHRDIKPGNVLLAAPLGPGGVECVKLVDFGLSKDLTGSTGSGISTPFLGTKYYRAPETRHLPARHADGHDVAKVDVYALGVTLFAMLGGQHPPESEEVTEMHFRSAAWQKVSADAKKLLIGLLKHDPEERLGLDDAIEHPWLQVPWRRASGEAERTASDPDHRSTAPAIDREGSMSDAFRGLPPPRKSPDPEEDALRDDERPREAAEAFQGCAAQAAPQFLPAFPEAPAVSHAARLGRLHAGRPISSPKQVGQQLCGAPGWGVVLSWLRADRASAEAQQVLSRAGMVPAAPTSFGRQPLAPAPQASSSAALGAGANGSRAGTATTAKPQGAPQRGSTAQGAVALPSATRGSGGGAGGGSGAQPDAATASARPPPAAQPVATGGGGPCHIRWITCAPRFSSTWHFFENREGPQGRAGATGSSCGTPGASPPAGHGSDKVSPSPPLSPDFEDDLDMSSAAGDPSGGGLDGGASTPGDYRGRRRRQRSSVIGFVHAPHHVSVDGVMVTITRTPRGERQGRPWAFASEVQRGHGFSSCEEAMRAAERAHLAPVLGLPAGTVGVIATPVPMRAG